MIVEVLIHLPFQFWLDGASTNTYFKGNLVDEEGLLFDKMRSPIETIAEYLGGEEFADRTMPSVVMKLNELLDHVFVYEIKDGLGASYKLKITTELGIVLADHKAMRYLLGSHTDDGESAGVCMQSPIFLKPAGLVGSCTCGSDVNGVACRLWRASHARKKGVCHSR